MKRYRLMIPGPVEVVPEVLAEMAQPLVAHYGEEWTAFYKETIDFLRKVFQTKGDVFLIVGSGSAGLDAALGSTVAPDKKVLIPQNGFFGERLEEIARTYTPYVTTLKFPLGQTYDLEQIEKALRKYKYDVLAAVHCETSTGVLNPIKELAGLCNRYGVLLIVDAISSLAIEPLKMDAWGIGICVSASQKGLESPPGLAVVAVGPQAWELIEQVDRPGWYLNLRVWREYTEKWGDWHPHPITQAVNNVRALRVGVERILAEGLEARFERHREVTAYLRQGLRDLGLTPFVADEVASHGVTSVVEPAGRVDELLACLRDRYGLLLAGTLGELKGKVFRVGHMGSGATLAAIRDLLEALEVCLAA
jgi:alanine-glyoxylate transaminase/serine-glyoxylate transaminase/serine-pyruvate transaminase